VLSVCVHVACRRAQLEISGYKAEAHKQRKQLFLLEKDGEKYGAEAQEATSKFSQAQEEVKVREMSIIQLQKRIAEGETKLKQQQALYEAVRSDRNLYSKNLIESQDEIAEMKRKFKIMNHQIEQLKEEIHSKDQNLVRAARRAPRALAVARGRHMRGRCARTPRRQPGSCRAAGTLAHAHGGAARWR
jgi:chromosome segregation ATPase